MYINPEGDSSIPTLDSPSLILSLLSPSSGLQSKASKCTLVRSRHPQKDNDILLYLLESLLSSSRRLGLSSLEACHFYHPGCISDSADVRIQPFHRTKLLGYFDAKTAGINRHDSQKGIVVAYLVTNPICSYVGWHNSLEDNWLPSCRFELGIWLWGSSSRRPLLRVLHL